MTWASGCRSSRRSNWRATSSTAVPLEALSGATSLEKIELDLNRLQPDEEIEGQLDSLVQDLPRLQELKLSGSWERNRDLSYEERGARRQQLLARLRERHTKVRIFA